MGSRELGDFLACREWTGIRMTMLKAKLRVSEVDVRFLRMLLATASADSALTPQTKLELTHHLESAIELLRNLSVSKPKL